MRTIDAGKSLSIRKSRLGGGSCASGCATRRGYAGQAAFETLGADENGQDASADDGAYKPKIGFYVPYMRVYGVADQIPLHAALAAKVAVFPSLSHAA